MNNIRIFDKPDPTPNPNPNPIESIEAKVVSILYANPNVSYTHSTLFDKLIQDKYDDYTKNIVSLDTQFKAKYLLVLTTLSEKFDGISVSIEHVSTGIGKKFSYEYTIVYLDNGLTGTNDLDKVQGFPTISMPMYDFTPQDLDLFYRLVIESNPTLKFSNGNTVYHELVIMGQNDLIDELISTNNFDLHATNDLGKTPVDLHLGLGLGLELGKTPDDATIDKYLQQFQQKIDDLHNMFEQIHENHSTMTKHLNDLSDSANALLETTTDFENNVGVLKQTVEHNNYSIHIVLVIVTLNLCLYLFANAHILFSDTEGFS